MKYFCKLKNSESDKEIFNNPLFGNEDLLKKWDNSKEIITALNFTVDETRYPSTTECHRNIIKAAKEIAGDRLLKISSIDDNGIEVEIYNSDKKEKLIKSIQISVAILLILTICAILFFWSN